MWIERVREIKVHIHEMAAKEFNETILWHYAQTVEKIEYTISQT